MEVSLYQAAAAMNATEKWQDMIAENLASASTLGSRRHEISFSAVEAGMPNATLGNGGTGFMMPTATTTTSFQQGELRPTGNKMDYALEGTGFFTVQMPNGQKAYTRDGEFQFNSQGQLVTKQGYLVLAGGSPIAKDPSNTNPLSISATGDVSQGTDTKGKLQIVNFTKPQLQQLTMTGGGYFQMNDPNVIPMPATTTQVQQGFVEASNTSPTLEMASLITAMRMFETNQKVMQIQSDRMTKVISDLGTPPQ